MARRRGAHVPPPLVLIKLTPDGKKEALRGAVLRDAAARAFEEISAAGRDPEISDHSRGHSLAVAAPALLFEKVQVQKLRAQQAREHH